MLDFALEDISMESGPFYVMPKSHKEYIERSNNDFMKKDHEVFVERIAKRIIDEHLVAKPLCLKKGSIVIWHPFLIHGSFPSTCDSASRKSMTAHYYPLGYERNDYKQVPIVCSKNNNIMISKYSLRETMINFSIPIIVQN